MTLKPLKEATVRKRILRVRQVWSKAETPLIRQLQALREKSLTDIAAIQARCPHRWRQLATDYHRCEICGMEKP